MHTRGNIITDNNSKMEDVILKGKRNLKKLTEENKKEAKGSIKSIKTKEQEEIESVNAAALCPAVDVVNCPYIDGIGVHM